jgi:hypothetical protein
MKDTLFLTAAIVLLSLISTVTFPLSALAAIVLFSFSKMIVVFLFSRRSIKDTAITAARPQPE